MRQGLKSHPNCLPEKVKGVSYPKESWLLLAKGGGQNKPGKRTTLIRYKRHVKFGGLDSHNYFRNNDFFYFPEAQVGKGFPRLSEEWLKAMGKPRAAAMLIFDKSDLRASCRIMVTG